MYNMDTAISTVPLNVSTYSDVTIKKEPPDVTLQSDTSDLHLNQLEQIKPLFMIDSKDYIVKLENLPSSELQESAVSGTLLPQQQFDPVFENCIKQEVNDKGFEALHSNDDDLKQGQTEGHLGDDMKYEELAIKTEDDEFLQGGVTIETSAHFKSNQCFSSKVKLQEHQSTSAGKDYKCEICDKWFGHVGNYRKHLNKHARILICEQCGKTFNSKHCLNKHQLVHSDEKPYVCKECGKRFNQNTSLKIHYLIHTDDRPFQCRFCSMTFRTRAPRKRHEQIHTGEKPHKCELCDMSFVQRYNYQVHLRTHSGEKPFKCEQCGAAYKEPIGLIEHKRSHTGERPFKCEQCGKQFHRRGYLLIHLKIHAGNRAYKCSQCDKTFIRTCDLTRHEKVHLKERPFACEMCGNFFARKDYIKTHKKICKSLGKSKEKD